MNLTIREIEVQNCCRFARAQLRVIGIPEWLESHIRALTNCISEAGARNSKYSTPENWVRFYLHHIFDTDDALLVLDDDTVALGDVDRLWQISMTNHAVACSTRSSWNFEGNIHPTLFNAVYAERFAAPAPKWNDKSWVGGVMLVNLRLWVQLRLTEHVEFLVHRQANLTGSNVVLFQLGTLVPLNFAVAHTALELPPQWNHPGLGYQQNNWPPHDVMFAHFNGLRKPWNWGGLHQDYFLQHYPPRFVVCGLVSSAAVASRMCANKSDTLRLSALHRGLRDASQNSCTALPLAVAQGYP